MSGPRERWRLLVHAPADAAWNMAVDEAILRSLRGSPRGETTLRLYAFRPPALSLGKSQAATDIREADRLSEMGIDLVRRPTGGRAVLHDRERTYAVIGRLGAPPFEGGVLETYGSIARALEIALREAGVDARVSSPSASGGGHGLGVRQAACFGTISAHEIAVGGRKLVGSAQLRRADAFLQHGSIPWSCDAQRLARLLGESVDDARMTDLEHTAAPGLSPAALDAALARGFERHFDVELVPGTLTDEEALLATRLRAFKYLSASWTLEQEMIGDIPDFRRGE